MDARRFWKGVAWSEWSEGGEVQSWVADGTWGARLPPTVSGALSSCSSCGFGVKLKRSSNICAGQLCVSSAPSFFTRQIVGSRDQEIRRPRNQGPETSLPHGRNNCFPGSRCPLLEVPCPSPALPRLVGAFRMSTGRCPPFLSTKRPTGWPRLAARLQSQLSHIARHGFNKAVPRRGPKRGTDRKKAGRPPLPEKGFPLKWLTT